MMDLLEAYDKYLPEALEALEGVGDNYAKSHEDYRNFIKNHIEDLYEEDNELYNEILEMSDDEYEQYKKDAKLHDKYLKEYLTRDRRDKQTEKHGKTLTIENLKALQKDNHAFKTILKYIVNKVIEQMSEEELYDAWDDEVEVDTYEEHLVKELEEALKPRLLSAQSTEMPEFLYRGIGGTKEYNDTIKKGGVNTEENILTKGFKALQSNPKFDKDNKYDKLLFVTTEPSVGASYDRKGRFMMIGNNPYNYGDNVYRIRTQGLDPEKFIIDDTATPEEVQFGPQYIYTDDIPQEIIEITDTAGNTRRVPRIERKPYLSDENCKDVYFPIHLIDAVKKRF